MNNRYSFLPSTTAFPYQIDNEHRYTFVFISLWVEKLICFIYDKWQDIVASWITTHGFHEYDISLPETKRKTTLRLKTISWGSPAVLVRFNCQPALLWELSGWRSLLNSAGRLAWLPLSALQFAAWEWSDIRQVPFSSVSCLGIVVANSCFYLVCNSATACGWWVYWFLKQAEYWITKERAGIIIAK